MASLRFKCSYCGQEYRLTTERLAKLAGKSVACRKCGMANAFRIPLDETPTVVELSPIKDSFCEVWAGRLTLLYAWLRSDPKKGWVAFFVALLLVRVGYREFREVRQLWRAQRTNEQVIRMQELASMATASAARNANKPRDDLQPEETTSAAAGPKKESEKEEELPLKTLQTEQPVFSERQLVEPTNAVKAYPTFRGRKELSFTNGEAVLLEEERNPSRRMYRGVAAGGPVMTVQHGGRLGLFSFYRPGEGTIERSIATELIGAHPLLASPDGRYVAALSYGKSRRTTVLDIASNLELVNVEATPLCFSPDGKELVLYMESGELRIVEASTGFEAEDSSAYSEIRVGRVTAASYLHPDLLLVGTFEGDLLMIEVPVRSVIAGIKLGIEVEKIYPVSREDKAVVQLGFKDTGAAPAGQTILAWVDCLIDEDELQDKELAKSRYSCKLIETGRKYGSRPVISRNGQHMAVLEHVPTGEGKNSQATKQMMSIYSTTEPNRLLRVIDRPLQLSQLSCFANDGKRLYGIAGDEAYMVIDLETNQAYLVGNREKADASEKLSRNLKYSAIEIDERHFVGMSNFGQVRLFRLPDCLQHAETLNNSNPGISREAMSKIGERGLPSIGLNANQARATSYRNGRISLTSKQGKQEVSLMTLSDADQKWMGWVAGGPTEERDWQLVQGAAQIMSQRGVNRQYAGKRDLGRMKAKLLMVDGQVAYFEQDGEVARHAMAEFSTVQLGEMALLGRRRFKSLLPQVEQLWEAKLLDGRSPLEGAWEIVEGDYLRYSIAKNYPRRDDRIVRFQGNRVIVPRFTSPAEPAVTSWMDYRFVYYPKTKTLMRVIDDSMGSAVAEAPILVNKRGDELEWQEMLPYRRASQWKMRRLREDQLVKLEYR